MHKSISIVRRQADATLLGQLPKAIPLIVRRLLAQRNLQSPEEAHFTLQNLHSNKGLSGLEKASELIGNAIIKAQKILIVGDYDADGATATALSFLVLKEMGAEVAFYSTDRFSEGYGMSAQLITKLHKTLDFQLLITVDLGISANDGVKLAKELGYQVIITDHHLPPKALPNADSIVNPNLPNCRFPSKNLSGVGVVFYTLSGVRQNLDNKGWFIDSPYQKPNLAKYLDLVAIGTIADVMELDANNKILVAKGLNIIQNHQGRIGISILLKKYCNSMVPDTQDLSYQLIPRLNSAGRMSHMRDGVEWLITDDPKKAQQLSKKLNHHNVQRKQLEKKIYNEAKYIITHEQMPDDLVKVAYKAEWHVGIIGIIAGKIKQEFYRPCFIFCQEFDGTLKGSGRSIAGINLNQVLTTIAQKHPQLLNHYGGHSMAAGVNIDLQNYAEFRECINREINQVIHHTRLYEQILETDGVLENEFFNLQTVRQLRDIPWGHTFPRPVFDGQFKILWHQQRGEHAFFAIKIGEKRHLECVAFNQKFPTTHQVGDEIQLIYELKEKYYAGKCTLQLIAKHILPANENV